MLQARTSVIRTCGKTGGHRAGCSKRPSSKAAASEEVRRTLQYVEPLSEARTTLADFFSVLLKTEHLKGTGEHMRKVLRLSRTMGIVGMVVLGWSLSGHCMEEITPVAKIWANPSAFHRHNVVLKGILKLVSRWEGKDAVGAPTCGPIFKLDDDSGDIPVLYIIRCDPAEEIAEALDLSLGTVMSRLSRAREKLRGALAGYLGPALDRAGGAAR